MPRPMKPRWLERNHGTSFFGPMQDPGPWMEQYELTLDELEALRLSDIEGMHQADAAALMNISRQTFGRIITSARKKTALALIRGKALRIQGGVVRFGRPGEPQRGPHGPHGHRGFGGGQGGKKGRHGRNEG